MAYSEGTVSYPTPSTKPGAAFDDLGRELSRLSDLAERLSRLTDALVGPRPRGAPEKAGGPERGLVAARTAELAMQNERLADDVRALEGLLP